MSRVPSSLQRRRRREPETSPPRREDTLRPARSCRLGGQGPGLRSLGHRPPPGPCVCAGRAAALFRRGEARPARNCPSPPQAPRERASGRAPPTAPPPPRHAPAPTAALPPACEHRARAPTPVTTPTTSRDSAPRQVMDPRGNSRVLACRDTERRRRELPPGLRGGAETDAGRLSGSALEVTSSRRPERGFPPASTSSSQLCRRRRCRKRRRGNRLTSPPDCARAPQPDRSEERDL